MINNDTNNCLECGYCPDGKWTLCMKCESERVGVTMINCESCGRLIDSNNTILGNCIKCYSNRIWGE